MSEGDPSDLARHAFFSLFDAPCAARLLQAVERIRLEPDSAVFEEGDPSDNLFLVLSGSITLSKKDPEEEKRVVIGRVLSDDFFGEFGILDGGPRSARATVDTEVAELGRIPREVILQTLHEPGPAGIRLLAHMVHKIRAANDWYVREILRNERMMMVGRMANEIIHDFKNPFAVIRLAAEVLEENTPESTDAGQLTHVIAEQINRMTVMTEDILQFSKGRTTLHPKPFAIGELLDRFENLFSRYLADQKVELAIIRATKTLIADQDKLLRVLQNLVNNAAESFAGKPGKIEIRAEDRGDHLLLTVRDNGPGLPKSIRDRPFEAFGSEGKSRGTGLGMAISKSIVVAHGGTIAFETEAGKGTTFLIRLPSAPPT